MSLRPTKSFPAPFRVLPLVAALASLAGPVAAQTVTNTASSGAGSLFDAITQANANCATTPSPVINFAITGTGPFTIAASSPLPTFFCGAGPFNPTVDGTSQLGWTPNGATGSFDGTNQISIDGLGHITPMCGLSSAANSLTVKGVTVLHYNVYGTDAGICGSGLNLQGNILKANTTGIKTTGSNGGTIGGPSAADANVINGNSGRGIDLQATGTHVVQGNLIGLDVSGAPSANAPGIYAYGAGSTTISNNIVSANSGAGVQLDSPFALISVTGNTITNNINAGIRVDNGPGTINIVGNNTITGNTIGIDIQGGTGVFHNQNNISGNSSKAVALGVVGGTRPNDAGDVDGGPNNGQNYPDIQAVNHSAGNTIVTFSFNSDPSATFYLAFYSTATAGVYEGQAMVGSIVGATTDAAGDLSSTNTVTLTGTYNNISAVASRILNNDTSEFSQSVAVAATPAISLVPPVLAFGNVGTGSTSPSQTSSYSSTGSGTVSLFAVGSPGCYGGPVCYGTAQFICSTTCYGGGMYPPSPAPGSACTVTASFAPSVLGPQSTTIQFCDNAGGSPREITLTGTGVAPAAFTLTPGSYDFGSIPVGSTAATTFTLQNTGAAPIPMGTYSAGSSAFAVQRVSCNNPIQVGEVCRIDVGFTPTATGAVSDSLVVTPSAGTPVSSGLQGTGTIAPQVLLPGLIELVYLVGATPAVSNLTLRNTGTAPATIDGIVITGLGFTLEHNCPATLAVGESCVAKILFSSSAPGDFTGSLTVMTNAPGGSRAIQLLAHASLRPVPLLQVTPREIGYGARAFGTTSPTSPVILKNIGGADVRFDSIVVSPDFVIISKSCGDVLPSLASCELQVAMRATSYGQRFGYVTINSNAESSPHRASVFGTSCRIGGFVTPRQGLGTGC